MAQGRNPAFGDLHDFDQKKRNAAGIPQPPPHALDGPIVTRGLRNHLKAASSLSPLQGGRAPGVHLPLHRDPEDRHAQLELHLPPSGIA